MQELIDTRQVKVRVREDTKRLQVCTMGLFDYVVKNDLGPEAHEALFILTDVDLYPKEGWSFVFGVTRPHFRISI